MCVLVQLFKRERGNPYFLCIGMEKMYKQLGFVFENQDLA